nr:PREDICTED: LOW QUALITY PROTEIN: rhodopsin kinase [Rhinolophus sinicus]
MVDMGGLDNLMANTAYLQARKTLDGNRRVLPRPQCCAPLHQALPPDFHSLCEEQPIGRCLFRDFLATVAPYQEAVVFLEEVQSWELAEEGPAKGNTLQGLVATCAAAPGPGNPHPFLSPALATKCQAATTEEEGAALVALAKAEAMAFLQDQPFRDFLASPFYDKFLQWKAFEMQPLADKYFTEFRVLGKGGFGEVCAIQVKNTGKMYACKKLDKKLLKKKHGEQRALSEKESLASISSPFLVSLACAFESKSHLCLVMSLMNGGDLRFHAYSAGRRGLATSRVVFYSAQMPCGVLHLHSLAIVIVCWDPKPENVLLDDLGHCRLSDLGLAVQIQEGKPVTQRAGTNGYMAPEILMDKVNYSYPVDWFAVGCSIYEMVAGRTPLKEYNEKVSIEDLKQRSLKEEVRFHHGNFTEEAKDVCRLFLAKKPEQRLGGREKSDDPRKDPFFKTISFPRLEAGLVEPPYVPDPSVVYAKDIDEIEDFSEVRGIEVDDNDKKVFQRFATGAVPTAWQEEMIETGLFEELSDPNRPAGYWEGNSSKSGVCLLL